MYNNSVHKDFHYKKKKKKKKKERKKGYSFIKKPVSRPDHNHTSFTLKLVTKMTYLQNQASDQKQR